MTAWLWAVWVALRMPLYVMPDRPRQKEYRRGWKLAWSMQINRRELSMRRSWRLGSVSLASRYETCEVKNEKQKCVLVENICRNHALFSLFSFPVQMGTNKCASQAGMNAYGTRRHLYDPKANVLPPMDSSTIGLQMGTNKGASQVFYLSIHSV